MEKLTRLESIIQHLASEHGIDRDVLTTGSNTVNSPDSSHSPVPAGPSQEKDTQEATTIPTAFNRASPIPYSLDKHFGQLLIEETKSYYVSNVLWANLVSEVDDMREMLREPEEDDANDDTTSHESSSCGTSNSNAALFGFRALANSLQAYHPPLSKSVKLFAIFTENISPQIRLFHMPTLSRIYWDAIASFESLDKNIEALLFAIYYSAVVSIDDRQAMAFLGLSRAEAMERYRFATEQAMARADLLNTQSMVLLQAAVLFLSALRTQDNSRTAWSLTTLVFHIAQTMGMHRDGTVFGLKPFETELRRRLWWQICILDSRSSQYHGFQPVADQSSFDTKFPLHINDADWSPDMKDFPPVRKEPTDATMLLLRCEALDTAWKIGMVSPNQESVVVPGRAGPSDMPFEERKAIVRRLEKRIKENYFQGIASQLPIVATIANMIVLQFWLVIHHLRPGSTFQNPEGSSRSTSNKEESSTQGPSGSQSSPSVLDGATGDRDTLFTKSIDVLELSFKLLHTPGIEKWTWYSGPHFQSHAAAFVLAEICSRPPSPETDRAWQAVSAVYELRGTMWRPVRRLMAKARYVREMQAQRKGGTLCDGDASSAGGLTAATPSTGFTSTSEPSPAMGLKSYGFTPVETPPLEGFPTDNSGLVQGILGVEADDRFLELLNLPDEQYTDELSTYGISGGSQGFSLGMMGAGNAMDGWDGGMW
ncbi:hypothetical protein VPNG_09657 [Cytospora leucostoma]|uniref:Xylanolytic transcriptional activator regulatory domain-containing protein n=1 Tax=Cytospora leucostoma TaxID=1230097 RepID=A0A423VMQ8_9PEZI|nr:hypothetical protein VPNG_09657 [Cytospora leucostoma]